MSLRQVRYCPEVSAPMAATIAAYERRKRRKVMKQGRLKWDSGYHYFLLLFSCSVRPEWSWTNLSAKFSSAETLWPFWTFLFSALDKGNNNISAKKTTGAKTNKTNPLLFPPDFSSKKEKSILWFATSNAARNAHLHSEGESISKADLLVRTG